MKPGRATKGLYYVVLKGFDCGLSFLVTCGDGPRKTGIQITGNKNVLESVSLA